jgi:hypothetical protein
MEKFAALDANNRVLPCNIVIDYAKLSAAKDVTGVIVNVEEMARNFNIAMPIDMTEERTNFFQDICHLTFQRTSSLEDELAISSGTHTIGSGAGDDYPTYGGAGGAFADLANLTAAIELQTNSAITETASAQITEDKGAHTLKITSNSKHLSDPTGGYIISVNHQNYFMDLQGEGAGDLEIEHQSIKWIAASAGTNWVFVPNTITDVHTIKLHDLLIDGNGAKGQSGIRQVDGTPILHLYNFIIWDFSWANIDIDSTHASSIIENGFLYNSTQHNCDLSSKNLTVQNVGSYGGGTTDFRNHASATGNNNASSDATAADGNWSSGADNQTSNTVGNDVESTTDTDSSYFDITEGGALDGAGIANLITARTKCIRNRDVKSPPSIGAAEVPAAGAGHYFFFNSGRKS